MRSKWVPNVQSQAQFTSDIFGHHGDDCAPTAAAAAAHLRRQVRLSIYFLSFILLFWIQILTCLSVNRHLLRQTASDRFRNVGVGQANPFQLRQLFIREWPAFLPRWSVSPAAAHLPSSSMRRNWAERDGRLEWESLWGQGRRPTFHQRQPDDQMLRTIFQLCGACSSLSKRRTVTQGLH
jgi:hypothetical protein